MEKNQPVSTAQELDRIRDFTGPYPRQIWSLFFSEMWERFSFYGMRGMLTFFMVHVLLMDESTANKQYGATQAFVYAFTFIGGLFADTILGFRRSLFFGGLLMIAGSLLLAWDPVGFFFPGISFNIIGTGFFKPNISTMVGALYREGDPRKDAGFSLFYSGINIGAFFGGYLCIATGKGTLLTGLVPEALRWNVAFGMAAVFMTISLVTFLFTRKTLGPIGRSPLEQEDGSWGGQRWKEFMVYGLALLSIPFILLMVPNPEYTDRFMMVVGPGALLYLFFEMRLLAGPEIRKLMAALCFILFSVIFWAIFEQAGGSLSLFAADNLKSSFFGLIELDPNGVNNSANSLFVIFFAPVIGLLWLWLARRSREPNTVVKFGIGFLFLGLGFLIFYLGRFAADPQGKSSLELFTFAYLIITFGELCVSPIGLSIMTKLAPLRLQGLMMGMWFLASAYGQYVAGLFGSEIVTGMTNPGPMENLMAYTGSYMEMGWYAVAAGLVLLALSPLVRKLMQEVS